MRVGEERTLEHGALWSIHLASAGARAERTGHPYAPRSHGDRCCGEEKGDRKESGWQHKPKQICVKELFYIKHEEQ